MTIALEIASLGRLIETGSIREVKRNKVLIKRFETAMWLERSNRKSEWVLREGRVAELKKRISDIAPNWNIDFEYLRAMNLDPYDPSVIEMLPILKQRNIPNGLTNRRNWNAITGSSPKHTSRIKCESQLTSDWVLRFRPNSGLKAVFKGGEIGLDDTIGFYTECVFPERMWLGFDRFEGRLPRTIITCENLGAYIDLPVPEDVMVIFSPGRDIVSATELLKHFSDVAWFHFGDLDPYGIDIAKSVAVVTQREVSFYIPTFAKDYLPGSALGKDQRWNEISGFSEPVMAELQKTNSRIFQEVFMLDKRLPVDLEKYCRDGC